MQGFNKPIDTATKVAYLNQLLQVGFDVLDCGSFVSPKAIPQMADTAEVLPRLQMAGSRTQLLVIVANERGAQEAVDFPTVSFLGYPFSISPTFQQRNANSTLAQSWQRVQAIHQLCLNGGKQLVVYLSMAFGNPYGDAYQTNTVVEWADKLANLGVRTIALADTVGMATPQQVNTVVSAAIAATSAAHIGVHLHSTPQLWLQKVEAALAAGCLRFDGAINGVGGCPMAGNALVGNMDTALMVPHWLAQNRLPHIQPLAMQQAVQMATGIFST
ncbi:MAG: hydroxymethylglutaryl-CoA lyase [Bacteroidetes bacterium]|nr:MAG: hydroxymethylglutaryl-CoA lyase [Bacteroidota bacterium]